MVYVNNKKFACESCIKGHRSSSCHHTDRPLFEIKKKGRPVSQCKSCRELRQSKKVHSKCTCDPTGDKLRHEQLVPLSAGSKSRRYIPIVPALPNGLRDVLQSAKIPISMADSRQKVDTLLNPCKCSNLWNCDCAASASTSQPGCGPSKTSSLSLAALAHAASLQPFEESSSSSSPVSQFSPNNLTVLGSSAAQRNRLPSPPQSSRKRSKRNPLPIQDSPGPSLAPLRAFTPLTSYAATTFSDLETMPPINEIHSLAGTGCTCGVQCACPGCVQHRGSEHASQDRRDCADGCGTCVDHSVTELQFNSRGASTAPSVSSPSASFLDQFFARAAALPPPPLNRRIGLDPTDTSSYRALDSHQAAVTLPKLTCCGGACLCPAGECSCGASCGGACLEHRFRIHRPNESPSQVTTGAPKSCCAGKSLAVAAIA